MIWLSWTPGWAPHHSGAADLVIGLAGLGVVLALVALHSRFLVPYLSGPRYAWGLRRHGIVSRLGRYSIPLWFGIMVYGTDYPQLVREVLSPLRGWPVEAPAFLLGILPAMLAWVGLWWALYPADRALREQMLVLRLDANMPIRGGLSLLQHLLSNIRLQLLFLLAPVLCILVLRDIMVLMLVGLGVSLTDGRQLLVSLVALVPVMLLAPVMLVRILPTAPLPESPLRRRLDDLCITSGFRVGRILLWKTGDSIGNAAVMGMLPRLRYLLLTDLLLASMSDEEILAVLAHEIGHVMHRHLIWMAAAAVALMLAMSGPIESIFVYVERFVTIPPFWYSLGALVITLPLFLLAFGMFVRRLERQADVFAARKIPRILPGDDATPLPAPDHDFVRLDGAVLVCSALNRIATINSVPTHANEWLHGSIASRMKFLMGLCEGAERTWRFDAFMKRLMFAVFLALGVMGAWTIWNIYH